MDEKTQLECVQYIRTYVTISSMGGINRIRKTEGSRKENINRGRRKGKDINRKGKKRKKEWQKKLINEIRSSMEKMKREMDIGL